MADEQHSQTGRPPFDDTDALAWMGELRQANPRISYREAARKWVRIHPPPPGGPKPESVARRLADKLRTADGVLPRRSREEKELFRVLQSHLQNAWAIVRYLRNLYGEED